GSALPARARQSRNHPAPRSRNRSRERHGQKLLETAPTLPATFPAKCLRRGFALQFQTALRAPGKLRLRPPPSNLYPAVGADDELPRFFQSEFSTVLVRERLYARTRNTGCIISPSRCSSGCASLSHFEIV